jgi:hypothetical protein
MCVGRCSRRDLFSQRQQRRAGFVARCLLKLLFGAGVALNMLANVGHAGETEGS